MEKNEGGRPETGSTLQPVIDTPTYSELGIDKTSASREQLVKRAFDEERILDICSELIEKNQVRRLAVHVAQVGAFLVVAKGKVRHGEWYDWLDENCSEVHYETVRKYMRTYDGYEANPNLIWDLTTMQAYKILGIIRDPNDITEIVEPLPPPVGTYHTIVIDPPWEMQKIERVDRSNQHGFDYQTKTVEQISEMRDEVLGVAAPNCHLYLWTTHKYLPSAIEIIEAWGFNYQCLMTWVKNVGFTPFSWMYSTEPVRRKC